MELQPAVHMQHLNHGHQQHHSDLNAYQHHMTNINDSNGEDKSKSKCQVHESVALGKRKVSVQTRELEFICALRKIHTIPLKQLEEIPSRRTHEKSRNLFTKEVACFNDPRQQSPCDKKKKTRTCDKQEKRPQFLTERKTRWADNRRRIP